MDTTGIQYCETIPDAIGRTPLIRLRRVTQGLHGLILAKAEFLNPGGSVKDRIGRTIISGSTTFRGFRSSRPGIRSARSRTTS